jgi:hypothetical protein
VLLPGWYARNKTGSIVTTTAPCPQGYYCPGGPANTTFNPSTPAALPAAEGSIKRCPSGMWTVELASTAVAECCKLQEILFVIMFDKTVWLSPHEPLVPL